MNRLVLNPYRRRKRAAQVLAVQREKAEEIRRAKASARDAATMMADMARRSSDREKERDGLVIERAVFGAFPTSTREFPTDSSTSEDEGVLPDPWVDVTIALQFMVSDGILEIQEGLNKSRYFLSLYGIQKV